MKTIVKAAIAAILAGAVLASPASAATDITFTVTPDGIVTDTGDVVDYANIAYVNSGLGAYRVVISVNGQAYTGYVSYPDTEFQAQGTAIVNGISVYTGQTATGSVEWTSNRTCTHSGRGQHCTTYYHVTGGTVSIS